MTAMAPKEHSEILARLVAQDMRIETLERRTKSLSDSDLIHHERIREALELVRALSAAVELLLLSHAYREPAAPETETE